jgi:hypothetical protein
MPVTTKNTNYGDIRGAHRHHVTPAAPIAIHTPVLPPKTAEPTIIPTAVKVAAVAEQKAAAVIQADKDAAEKAKAAEAAPAEAQATGPIPSPFDVLGSKAAKPS